MAAEAACKAVREHLKCYGIDENLISGQYFCPQTQEEKPKSDDDDPAIAQYSSLDRDREPQNIVKPEKPGGEQYTESATTTLGNTENLWETPEAKVKLLT